MILGGIQKSTLIDYPGKVAAIVFTRGCPLRCHYCHNPELVLPERFVEQIPEKQLFDFLEKRRGKLDGVVVTGGEPMMHKDLPEFLRKIKAMGFLVKLDTNGLFPEMLQLVLKGGLVDYVAMDLKAPFGRYSEVAGVPVDTEKVKKSIGIIKASGVDYEFRTTVVRQQLSEADLCEMAGSVSGAKKYIIQKFRKSDTVDPMFSQMDSYDDSKFGSIATKAGKHVESCEMR